MNYQDILQNEHFNNLAATIRVAFHSAAWKQNHTHVPFWTLNKAFADAVFIDTEMNKELVIERFTALITALADADPALCWYTAEDMDWFLQTLDSDHAKVVLSLFLAWYSAPDTYYTPAEIASITGTAESGWRNKAAAGEIPGAIKKGKQWLIPRTVLRAQGVKV